MYQQPYVQMFDLKRWADHGLHEAIAANIGELEEQEIFLLRRILDHIHTVDRIFQHHLLGTPHDCRAAHSEALPALDALAEGMESVDDWYASYVRGLSAIEFEQPIDFVFTSGKAARMRRGEILLHVGLHGTYHRGNAGAVLQLADLTPGRDGITDFLEQAA